MASSKKRGRPAVYAAVELHGAAADTSAAAAETLRVRQALNLSQEGLAVLLRSSWRTISGWETGTREPDPQTASWLLLQLTAQALKTHEAETVREALTEADLLSVVRKLSCLSTSS